MGLPWWLSGKESTCQCRRHGFCPWSGKIPHAAEQLSPWAATIEPELRSPGTAATEPAGHSGRGPRTQSPCSAASRATAVRSSCAAAREEPLSATRGTPAGNAAAKAQRSQNSVRLCAQSLHSCPALGPQPARLLGPWGSPGKNTGVGCHALLQGIFSTQGLNLCLLHLLHCRQVLDYWATWEARRLSDKEFNKLKHF